MVKYPKSSNPLKDAYNLKYHHNRRPWLHMDQNLGTSLNPKLVVAVQIIPVLRIKIGQFRIWSVVEKQLQHKRSQVW